MNLLLLLAQTVPAEPISGGAGWVGAGLLGLVLGWLLLIHLPAKDKQQKEMIEAKDKHIKEFIEAKDKQVKEMIEAKDEHVKDVIESFKAEAAKQRDHDDRHLGLLYQKFDLLLEFVRAGACKGAVQSLPTAKTL